MAQPANPLPNELSVRAADGTVSPTVQQLSGASPSSHSQVILLIHGYDNAIDAARGSYNTFVTNFQTWLTQNAPNRVNLANVFALYWPGDKNWGPFSFGSYSLEI